MATVQLPPVQQPAIQVNTTVLPATDQAKIRATQRAVRVQSILQLVGAGLLLLFGIVAIVLMAMYSYYATPMWTAVAIYTPGGIVGLLASKSPKRSTTTAFIVFSALGCAAAFSLFIVYICAASWENRYDYNVYTVCQPSRAKTGYCDYTSVQRKTIDAFLIMASIFLLVVDILSLIYGTTYLRMTSANSDSCAACCAQGCSCCIPPPQPTTAVFTTNAPPLQQGNVHGLQAGAPQPQQICYVVQQGPIQGQHIPGVVTTYPGQVPFQGQQKFAEPPVLPPSAQRTAPNVHTDQPNYGPPSYSQ